MSKIEPSNEGLDESSAIMVDDNVSSNESLTTCNDRTSISTPSNQNSSTNELTPLHNGIFAASSKRSTDKDSVVSSEASQSSVSTSVTGKKSAIDWEEYK